MQAMPARLGRLAALHVREINENYTSINNFRCWYWESLNLLVQVRTAPVWHNSNMLTTTLSISNYKSF
jgi:hypothetical protein